MCVFNIAYGIFLFFMIFPQVIYSVESKTSDNNIPIYDLSKDKYCLEIRVKETVYASGKYSNVFEGISANIELGKDSSEKVLIKYLFYIITQQFNKVPQLYLSDDINNAIEIAKFIRTDLDLVNRIKFIKKWYFDDFEIILVDLIKSDGKTNIMGFGLKRMGDKYYRSDDWSENNEILSLFYYMTVNFKKNIDARHRSKIFKYSVDIGNGNNNPITIYFDGNLHNCAREWMVLKERAKDGNSAISYIHNAMVEIPNLNDREFLELWYEKDKVRIQRLLIENPNHFISTRRMYNPGNEIKDIFTLELGEFYVHYYIAKTQPSRVRTMFIKRVDKGYYLSDDVYSTIKIFLKSDVFINKLMNMWEKQEDKRN